jgi:hypothetical protein
LLAAAAAVLTAVAELALVATETVLLSVLVLHLR